MDIKTILEAVYLDHLTLGDRGKQVVADNSFGQQTLVADWQAEEVIIDALSHLPARIVSEEHGVIERGDEFTIIMDGIDGTRAYCQDSGRYGTMLAVFSGDNPRYRDYLAAGILEYPGGQIITTEDTLDCRNDGRLVYVDGWPVNRSLVPRLSAYDVHVGDYDGTWGASSIYYADLVRGRCLAVLECTRKRNLELAVAYGLICEAGGVMLDLAGNDLGMCRYRDFGQDVHIPIVSGAVPVASELIALLAPDL